MPHTLLVGIGDSYVSGGVAFDRAQDLRLGRGVVAEHAGHAGKDKVIRVAVLFALVQVMVQVAAQRFDRVGGQVCAKVLHHEVGRAVGAQPQHVAKVIVLAVPHQQPLPGGPFCLYHSRRRRAWQAARAKKKKQKKSAGKFLKNAPFPCCRRAPKALQ